MKATLARAAEEVRTSFWFVPALLFAAALALAAASLFIDRRYAAGIPDNAWWAYAGSPDAARAVLAAIAGSIVTVASLVFSVTIVTLTLAAGQFGSRMLQNFMRDVGNQVVLGAFVATFTYNLMVLRSVHDDFVPQISVSVAVLLVFVSVALLIYFIHHVATKIQAEWVVASVFSELTQAIDQLLPHRQGEAATDGEVLRPPQEPPFPVCARESNYLQALELERLMDLAVGHDLVIQVLHRPGQFAIRSAPLLLAWPRNRVDEGIADALLDTVILGIRPTLTQDAEHGIHQLVEIAVRALSPGINDPFTALNCIDRLGAVLYQLAGRTFPGSTRRDASGRVRLFLDTTSYRGYVDAALNQIRQNAASHPAVMTRLLEAIGRAAEAAQTAEQRDALLGHATMIRDAALAQFTEARDRAAVQRRYDRVLGLVTGACPQPGNSPTPARG